MRCVLPSSHLLGCLFVSDSINSVNEVTNIRTTADFLKAARASGFATVDGLSMLIGQADHAFRRFFGAQPPRGEADAELRARLLA